MTDASELLPEPRDLIRWMLWPDLNGTPLIVLVVDDSDDDEMASVFASETTVPSPNFDGVWGTGERDGNWLVAFRLGRIGGGTDRVWVTDNIHRPLLEAILELPHLVAVVPEEIIGDATLQEDVARRLGSALILEVGAASPEIAQMLSERGDD